VRQHVEGKIDVVTLPVSAPRAPLERFRVRDCQGIPGTKCETPRKPDGAVSEKITATRQSPRILQLKAVDSLRAITLPNIGQRAKRLSEGKSLPDREAVCTEIAANNRRQSSRKMRLPK